MLGSSVIMMIIDGNMMLYMQERRELRIQTEKFVYPLLPLLTDAQLEEAFRPVLGAVNDR